MRILQIGRHYQGWFKAIEAAGHELLVLPYWQWFSTGLPQPQTGDWEGPGDGMTGEQVNRRVIDEAIDFEPDLVIQFKGWMDTNRSIWPETIKTIKEETDCLTAYWSVDDPDFTSFWRHWHREGAQHWDIALSCCKASLQTYLDRGVADARYFLPGFDTEWPIDDEDEWGNPPDGAPIVEREAVDLVVIGHPYWNTAGCDLGRAAIAVAAKRAGFSVEIYGPGREHWLTTKVKPGFVPFLSGYPELESCYKGLLDFENVWRGVMRGKVVFNNHLRKCASGYGPEYFGYVNDKTPMIPGTGALMMMDHQPGMSPDVLIAGEEYLEYAPNLNPHTCLMSAMGLLEQAVSDDALRERVRLAGQQRVLTEHTWAHRVQQLEDICRDHGRY